jgi:hypothetical protein
MKLNHTFPAQFDSSRSAYEYCGTIPQPSKSKIKSFHWQNYCALELVKQMIDMEEVGFACELLNIINANH